MVCTMYSGAPLSLQKLNLYYRHIQESPATVLRSVLVERVPKEFTTVLSFRGICENQ